MSADFSSAIQDIGDNFERTLSEIIGAEQDQGHLPTDLEANALAAYILSLMYGLSVMARRGKSSEELKSIVRTALTTMAFIDVH